MTDNMPGFSLDVMAGLRASLGDLTAQTRESNRLKVGSIPIDYRRVNNTIIPASGANSGIGLGGPQQGRVWLVRRIIVSGLTWGTAAAGTAQFFAAAIPSMLIAQSLDASMLVDESTAIPNKAFYSNRQVVIRNPESLHIVIVGGTPNQQYVASSQVEDYAEGFLGGLEEFAL